MGVVGQGTQNSNVQGTGGHKTKTANVDVLRIFADSEGQGTQN